MPQPSVYLPDMNAGDLPVLNLFNMLCKTFRK